MGIASLFSSSAQLWSRLLALVHGLRLAWIATLSACSGLVLFWLAPQTQGLFLEALGGTGTILVSWVIFYITVVCFWILPVYTSAQWILTRWRETDTAPTQIRRVADWVRSSVPLTLGALCLVSVLIGQLLALSNAPILLTDVSE